MNKIIITQVVGPNEIRLVCCAAQAVGENGLPGGHVAVEGTFTVEASDTTALATLTRLYLAGTAPEMIANAMSLGLLPPKAK